MNYKEDYKEVVVSYNDLRKVSNYWSKGNNERYYLKNTNPKLGAYITKEADSRGRYETTLKNGFLYLAKCYNDIEGVTKEVIMQLVSDGCIVNKVITKEVN